jgi:crossover junction endodeoxyribonuclease RuvC
LIASPITDLGLPLERRRMTSLILGIDPGLNRTGYAVLERSARGPVLREAGLVRSTQRLSLAERILEIGRGVKEVIEQYGPQSLAVEQVFSHAQLPKTAAEAGLEVVHYTPTEIKRLLTGSGRAAKEQVQAAIRREFGLDRLLEPNDVSDAAAVALCHYHSQRSLAKRLG